MSKGIGQKIGIQFTEEILAVSKAGFSITGVEHQYVNGPLIEGDYEVEAVTLHPSRDKAILITVLETKRFNNVVGELTVHYDVTAGELTGRGGAVKSFSVAFTPTELAPKPNPHRHEVLFTSTQVEAQLIEVRYTSTFETGQITVGSDVTANFEYVGIVNP